MKKEIPFSWYLGRVGYEGLKKEREMRATIIIITSIILYFIFWRNRKNDK